jgi:hypothetical protein
MEIAQTAVPHLAYAAASGLGPGDTKSVALKGDNFIPVHFTPAVTAPVLWHPRPNPTSISISAGQQTTITYQTRSICYTRVEIIHDSDNTPGVHLVRTLQDFTMISAETNSLIWDGSSDAGTAVAPGNYLARVQARTTLTSTPINYAVHRITVKP